MTAELGKNPSTHPGQVHFPLGQATFPAHLPHRQEPRQATHIHFETKSKFKAHGYNQVSTWSLTKITNNYNHVVLLIAQLEFTVPKWLPSTWSKFTQIKFLSMTENSCVQNNNAMFLSWISNISYCIKPNSAYQSWRNCLWKEVKTKPLTAFLTRKSSSIPVANLFGETCKVSDRKYVPQKWKVFIIKMKLITSTSSKTFSVPQCCWKMLFIEIKTIWLDWGHQKH